MNTYHLLYTKLQLLITNIKNYEKSYKENRDRFLQINEKFIPKIIIHSKIRTYCIILNHQTIIYNNINLEKEKIPIIKQNIEAIKRILKKELIYLIYTSIRYNIDRILEEQNSLSSIFNSLTKKIKNNFIKKLNNNCNEPSYEIFCNMFWDQLNSHINSIIDKELKELLCINHILDDILQSYREKDKYFLKLYDAHINRNNVDIEVIDDKIRQNFNDFIKKIDSISSCFSDQYLEKFIYIGYMISHIIKEIDEQYL